MNPVRLRPHHLLCLQTYVGEGYNAAFVAGYDRIVARIAAGTEILIVEGPDDLCAPLLGDAAAHCYRPSVTERDRLAGRDVGLVLGREVAPGIRLQLSAPDWRRLRAAFLDGATRAACSGCRWSGLCSSIAASGFDGTRLPGR